MTAANKRKLRLNKLLVQQHSAGFDFVPTGEENTL
jgi:hypothetical protein